MSTIGPVNWLINKLQSLRNDVAGLNMINMQPMDKDRFLVESKKVFNELLYYASCRIKLSSRVDLTHQIRTD